MVSAKIMWNSVISTPGAKFGGADIKNMYLETPLDRYEYMRMPLKLFPDDIVEHYNLKEKALNGYVYMEIRRGMYGLPQAGILANKLYENDWADTAISRCNTHPVCGSTSRDPYGSICVSTISASNISARKISNTFFRHYALRLTKLLKTGQAIYTAESISSGTTTNDGSTLQCLSMLLRISRDITIHHH
jgi:hypothetical protein